MSTQRSAGGPEGPWLVRSTASEAGSASEPEPPADAELSELLERSYVDAGFTDPSVAATVFAPSAVRARGELLYVRRARGAPLSGMVICAPWSAPGRRFAVEGEAELQLLAVRADERRSGIGRALVEAVIGRARVYGCRQLLLWSQPTMLAAHRLYQALDFQRFPERDFKHHGREFLFYRREL